MDSLAGVDNDQLGLFGGGEGLSYGATPACPLCGTRIERIIKDGFLGCETCYIVFGSLVTSALVSMHGTSRHTGKTL